MVQTILSVFIFCIMISNTSSAATDPIVIAHRGASGYLPEHTLEAATLAFSQGADYIEQDIVLTKDLIPVVLHDIHLDTVTNVAEVFPTRKRNDGRFYVFDFTLNELKTLRVHERKNLAGNKVFPNRYNGNANFTIATFEEHIELINELNRQLGKKVGLYPEIKSPAWHKKQGADISKIVLKQLRAHYLDDFSKNIYVQCFDFEETKRLRNELGAKVKLIQLIGDNSWNESETDYDFLQTQEGLKEIAKVAQGIGPSISHLINMNSQKIKRLAKDAHTENLEIHPYTFRIDSLPNSMSANDLLQLLIKDAEVNGLFSDFTDVAIQYIEKNKIK